MSDRSLVYLKDRRSGEMVEATFIDGVTKEEAEAADMAWRPVLEEAVKRMKAQGVPASDLPEHKHWDWRAKSVETEVLLAYRMFGIELDSTMQGLMLVLLAGKECRIESQKGKPLVYVQFLEAAPWNTRLVSEPRYALIGTILMGAAIQLSNEEEFRGRVGLHALRQSESWYRENCGMTDLGTDEAVEGLRYFEWTPEQAAEFRK